MDTTINRDTPANSMNRDIPINRDTPINSDTPTNSMNRDIPINRDTLIKPLLIV